MGAPKLGRRGALQTPQKSIPRTQARRRFHPRNPAFLVLSEGQESHQSHQSNIRRQQDTPQPNRSRGGKNWLHAPQNHLTCNTSEQERRRRIRKTHSRVCQAHPSASCHGRRNLKRWKSKRAQFRPSSRDPNGEKDIIERRHMQRMFLNISGPNHR